MNLRVKQFFTDGRNNFTNYCYGTNDNMMKCISMSEDVLNFWEVENRDYFLFNGLPTNNGITTALDAYEATLKELKEIKQIQMLDNQSWLYVYRVVYDNEVWIFQLSPYFLITLNDNQVSGAFVESDLDKEMEENYQLFLDSLINKIDEVRKSL